VSSGTDGTGAAQRSAKHSPRLDEALAAEGEEVAVGVPVDLNFELADEDAEVDLHAVEAVLHSSVEGALGDEERKRRSEFAAVLHPNMFPAERDALIRVARDEHALQWMLELLEQLPIDTRFDTVQDVWLAVGGHREERAVASHTASTENLGRAPSLTAAEPNETAPRMDRVRSERSVELIALGIAGWAFDCTLSVARVAASLLRRSVTTRT
jgi:hypothetical protein